MKNLQVRGGLQRTCARLIAWLLGSVFLLPPSTVSAAGLPGKWLEVQSDHFVVISNARPKDARKVAIHLEQIRQVLATEMPALGRTEGPPLLVFAAANERTMGRFFPIRWDRRGASRPAGVFSDRVIDQFIVLRADLVGGESFGLVYHEYFHFLANEAGFDLPTWLSEGMADFWGGGVRLTSKVAEVARPLPYRLRSLKDGSLIPLDVLMTVDRSSPYYRDRYRVADFYAQSWALTHMILLGDETGELKQQMTQYLMLPAETRRTVEGARQAFGDLEKLERRLRSYSRSLLMSYFKLPLPPEPDPASLRIRDLSEGEAAAHIARHLYSGQRESDRDELLELAQRDAPSLPVTHEALGIHRMLTNDLAGSLEAFDGAAKSPKPSALAHYGRAAMGFTLARRDGAVDDAVLKALESQLVASLQVDRGFAPSAARLADVYRRLDGARPDRALAAIRRAIEIEPDQTDYRLFEARVLREAGQDEEALEIVRREAEAMASQSVSRLNNLCWQGAIWGFAAEVLPSCDKALEQQPDLAHVLDSRGVAKALVGDFEGALEDLRAALAGAGESWSEQLRSNRQAWVEALAAGENPLPEGGYRSLADDPLFDGVGWLR